MYKAIRSFRMRQVFAGAKETSASVESKLHTFGGIGSWDVF